MRRPTRRAFLTGVGRAGGYGALYAAMQGLGLLAPPSAQAAEGLPKSGGAGTRVVVLGAGIAGLVTALEMGRAGYDVTVLEARDRVGGRVWTIRGGERVEQLGRPDQLCGWDRDPQLYFNAGAGRLPQWHHAMIGYARQFKVPLEVMVNANRSAKLDYGGKVVTERQAVEDARGVFAELLAKAIDRGALDRELTGLDHQRLVEFLGRYGDLGKSGAYGGSVRAGFADTPAGYRHPEKAGAPLALQEMLSANFWGDTLVFEDTIDMQAPMLQPVGGMDQIARAIHAAIAPKVRLGVEVREIRLQPRGVQVAYAGADGGAQLIEADYCVCSIPLPVLARIKANWSPEVRRAVGSVRNYASTKVAFQSRRFWEQDDFQYGGLGWTEEESEVVWYPSGALGADQGVLVGAYSIGFSGPENPVRYAARPFEERFAISRRVIEKFHPGRSSELTQPLTVSWGQTRYSDGTAAAWTPEQRATDYAGLLGGDGRLYFAGEHMSYLPAWQEGAALSAHEAVRLIHARVMANG